MDRINLYWKNATAEAVSDKHGVSEKDPIFSLRLIFPMTRVGKFTVHLKATDNLAKKTTTFDLPIAVVPAAN